MFIGYLYTIYMPFVILRALSACIWERKGKKENMMFDLELQRRIREKKTPLALTLAPEAEKLNGKFVKNFIDMFGDTPMAQAEALRYHGTTLLDAAAGKLPAVVLRGGAYLRHGMMGADVLANLVSAAHAKGLYVILDMNTAGPECWAGYGADAVTVCPYGGSGCLEAGEMLPIAAVRTGGQVQSLVAGDRALWLSVAEQMARRGAALAVSTGYSLDVRDVRRVCPGAFLLLEDCDGENALPAFDDMGHGALATDSALQYAAEPAAAVEEAVRAWKQWVTVV